MSCGLCADRETSTRLVFWDSWEQIMAVTEIQAMPAAAFTVFTNFWAKYRISVVLLCLKTVAIGFVWLSFWFLCRTAHFRRLPSCGCHFTHHADPHLVRNNLSHPPDSYYLWRWQTFLSGGPVQTVTFRGFAAAWSRILKRSAILRGRRIRRLTLTCWIPSGELWDKNELKVMSMTGNGTVCIYWWTHSHLLTKD